MIKNKRGSHISFIISFVLFISFLIFFIGIIKPFEKTETGKGTLLKHLENEIINDVSAEVLVISVKLENPGDCININEDFGIINFKIQENENLLKIYSSDDFQQNTFQCAAPQGYEIGLIRKQKYVLKSKVESLKNRYETGEDLKTKFGIPETNDFEFSFLGFDETLITIPKETPPTEVLAELIPIIYLDEDDVEIKNGYIKVILW